MKLPEKKTVPKYNSISEYNIELIRYAKGWNWAIESIEYSSTLFGDEYAKKDLLEDKNFALFKKDESMFYKGKYDCIVEIERLNEEARSEHRLGTRIKQKKALLVADVLMVDGKYICCDEQHSCPLWNKEKWCCEYKRNTNAKDCPLKSPPEMSLKLIQKGDKRLNDAELETDRLETHFVATDLEDGFRFLQGLED